MKNLYEKALKNILTALLEYKPEKVILFGSAAQGRWKPGGDIDLFIVKKTNKSHTERAWEVGELLFDKMDVPVDVVVYTPEEVKYAQKIRSMFIEEVLERGKVLYNLSKAKISRFSSETRGSYG